MPSVFPGVDPYLESQGYWSDFHATFMNYWREAIIDVLPEHYEARIEERQRSIRILRRPGRELVAILELLSPTNKEEPGSSLYEAKRLAILHQQVHLVELDLLRGGKRPPLANPLPKEGYFAVVADASLRPHVDTYIWGIRQRLPALPIPLTPPDAPIWVDLAAIFTTVFDRARFGRSIDYAVAPTAVAEADREWAARLVGLSPASGGGQP